MRLPDAVGRRIKGTPKHSIDRPLSEVQLAYVDACFDMLIEFVESEDPYDIERRRELTGLAEIMREVSVGTMLEASMN